MAKERICVTIDPGVMDQIRELTKANEVTVSEVTQDLYVWLLDLKEVQDGQKK